MSPRKLIDVEMEQTGKAAKSPSYQARQSNSDTVKRRSAMSSYLNKASGISQFNPYPQSAAKNPATGQSWFEVPSAEYQAWEKSKLDYGLDIKNRENNQDIDFTKRVITELRPKANDEMIRTLGNELKTRFPYAQYENETLASREIMNNALQSIPAFLNRSTAARLSPVSMSL